MKTYQLPAELRIRLWIVKAVALLGGFLFVWLVVICGEMYSPIMHGPRWLMWIILAAIMVMNALLLRNFDTQPDQQERIYLSSLGIDIFSVGYIAYNLIPHREMPILLLVGLLLITGFYNFVLPRTGGVLTSVMGMMLYAIGIYVSITYLGYDDAAGYSRTHVVGLILFGVGVVVASTLLTRRIKRGIDSIYISTDALALDLSNFAMDAAISVEVMTERNREVRTLLQLLQNITSVLEWDELFDKITASLRNRFYFDKFSVYLYDSETNMLDLTVERGKEMGTGAATNVPPDEGILGWCYSSNKGIVIPDVRTDPRYKLFNERGKRIRSLACQPLVFRGERLGVMCLDSEKLNSFDEKAFNFLESLAPLVAIAVSNSLSYSIAKAESHTDNLTGLSNHRGFMDKFVTMLEVAYTDEFSLALLIIDIDDFKKVNDTYGHLVGNIILTELSGILRYFFRGTDLVARYGGEEFITVMRGTKPDVAPRIAEQLRRKIETHQFPISLNRDAFKTVTVSLGLATSQDSNLQPEIQRGSRAGDEDKYISNILELGEQIIDNADQALYVAKREGKNQVRLSHQYPISQEPQSVIRIDGETDISGAQLQPSE